MSPQSADLLIELFTEELPPKSLRRLGDAFSDGIFNTLKAAGLLSADSKAIGYATPRQPLLIAQLRYVRGAC